MFHEAGDYKVLTGFNVDDQHQHGDLDRIDIEGTILPSRDDDKQNQIRGEDVAYLQEMYLRRHTLFNGGTYKIKAIGQPQYVGTLASVVQLDDIAEHLKKFSLKFDNRVLVRAQSMNAYLYSYATGKEYASQSGHSQIVRGAPIKSTSIPQTFPTEYDGTSIIYGNDLPHNKYEASDFNYKGESEYAEGAKLSLSDIKAIFEDHLKQKKIGCICTNPVVSLCPYEEQVIKGRATGSTNYSPAHLLVSNYYGNGGISNFNCSSDIEIMRFPNDFFKSVKAAGLGYFYCTKYDPDYSFTQKMFWIDCFNVTKTSTDWVITQSAVKTNAQFRLCGEEMGYPFRTDYLPDTAQTGLRSESFYLNHLCLYFEVELADYYTDE